MPQQRGSSAAGRTTVTVAGRTLALTNLDKVLFAGSGTTKAELLHYQQQIAPRLLPLLADRPVTRKRWPEGAGSHGPGKKEIVFFTKNIDSGTPDWLRRVRVEHSDRPVDYPLVDDLAGLTWLAQLAAIELHVPQWRFAHPESGAIGVALPPDRLVLDLDPGPGVSLAECCEVAFAARELLTERGHTCVPVTSGSKGVHLYSALDGSRSSDQVRDWAHELADVLVERLPGRVTSVMARSARPGRVFVDWSQNTAAKTTISPYSLRGREIPWVAAPRTWQELADPAISQLRMEQVLERLADPDPMADLGDPPPQGQIDRERIEVAADGHLPDDPGVPEPLTPMLASMPGGRRGIFRPSPGWVYEAKWDGVRAIAHLDPGRVRLRSRRGLDVAASYPEVVEALGTLTRSCVLDGEIIATDDAGRPSFGRLQHRINLTRPRDVARARAEVAVQLICFDLLALDGHSLLEEPWSRRRALLAEVVGPVTATSAGWIQVPPPVDTDHDTALEASRLLGLEGLVAKKENSRYHPGARSESWIKIKHTATVEVVVIGWRPGQGNRTGELGSLLVAVPGPDGLRYAGRVGTGFERDTVRRAHELLAPLERSGPPVPDVPRADRVGVTWLEPELVAEVEHQGWSNADRLWHPSWRGWLLDRSPDDLE